MFLKIALVLTRIVSFYAVQVRPNVAGSTTAAGPGLVDGMATVPGDFTVTAPMPGKVEVKIMGPALCGQETEIKEGGKIGVYTCRCK